MGEIHGQPSSGHCRAGKWRGSLRSLKEQVKSWAWEMAFKLRLLLPFLSVYLTILSPPLSQCRDTPAGTGERENDEETADDRTVKLSPGCLEEGMVPSVRFLSSGFVCSVRPGLHGRSKPTSGLTFIGKVICCLLSIRGFPTTQCSLDKIW